MMKITPKRRRKFLKPRNLEVWVGSFVRRKEGADPIPLEQVLDRYLQDTKAIDLRKESESMLLLRQRLASAIRKVWDIEVGEDELVLDTEVLALMQRGGKYWITVPSATILNMGSGFVHKDLCEAGTITGGSACSFSCEYCSVEATMFRSPDTAILRLLGIKHSDAVLRRLNPVETLIGQLTYRNGSPRFKEPDDRRVVFLSPIVDPLANAEMLQESLELILVVMEFTNWDVRLLTKSMLVKKLPKMIPEEYRHRVIYGLSLGILDDEIGKAVEKLTSLPSARIKAYRELQQQGLRTYSMHCPVLPQSDYQAYAKRLAEATDWDTDELVWVEALNSRSDSNRKTIDALRGSGFEVEAELLEAASSSHDSWELNYNRLLFQALAEVCPPGKLRFLVYASDGDRDFWLGQRPRGAVVLGKDKPLDD